jgi:hypothetical protein
VQGKGGDEVMRYPPGLPDCRPEKQAGGTVMTANALERPRAGYGFVALSGWSTIAGAVMLLILGIPLAALEASEPVPWAAAVPNAISHLLTLVGVVGLARLGAAGRGRLASSGLVGTVLGLAVLTLAEFVSVPSESNAEAFYSVGTLLTGLGLILVGVAMLRDGRWTGWRRFTPLACGLFLLLIVVPALFMPGFVPHYALGAWGICWLLLGLAQLADATPGA